MNSFFTCSLICLLCFAPSLVNAQQNHFIYIQSETRAPFYVKLDNTVHSSTASGYVILPKLAAGEYTLLVGFPMDQWPEQKLSVSINSRDEGYLLKIFGEKGWGLFNLRNMDVIMNGQETVKEIEPVREIKNDLFSNMLADVVNDSTIKQVDIVKLEPASQPVPIEQKMDSAVTTNADKPREDSISNTVAINVAAEVKAETTTQPVNKPGIKQVLSQSGKEGIDLVYIDESGDTPDTIRLFVAGEKLRKKEAARLQKEREDKIKADDKLLADRAFEATKAAAKVIEDSLNLVLQKKEALLATQNSTEINSNKSNITDTSSNPAAQQTQQPLFIEDKTSKTITTPIGTSMINSDCKKLATEEDYMKLRKKLAAEVNNSDMVDVAKKFFKTRCFTTEQVRNLSGLFINDEGKYQFFDAAYPYLYDTDNFKSLESLLSDSYYVNRFRAMIKK